MKTWGLLAISLQMMPTKLRRVTAKASLISSRVLYPLARAEVDNRLQKNKSGCLQKLVWVSAFFAVKGKVSGKKENLVFCLEALSKNTSWCFAWRFS